MISETHVAIFLFFFALILGFVINVENNKLKFLKTFKYSMIKHKMYVVGLTLIFIDITVEAIVGERPFHEWKDFYLNGEELPSLFIMVLSVISLGFLLKFLSRELSEDIIHLYTKDTAKIKLLVMCLSSLPQDYRIFDNKINHISLGDKDDYDQPYQLGEKSLHKDITEIVNNKCKIAKINWLMNLIPLDVYADSLKFLIVVSSFDEKILKSAEEKLKSADENLKSADENLKSAAENLKSESENLKSAAENLKSAAENLKFSAGKLKFSDENLKSADENLKSESENLKSAAENLKSAAKKLKSEVENIKPEAERLEAEIRKNKGDLSQYSLPPNRCAFQKSEDGKKIIRKITWDDSVYQYPEFEKIINKYKENEFLQKDLQIIHFATNFNNLESLHNVAQSISKTIEKIKEEHKIKESEIVIDITSGTKETSVVFSMLTLTNDMSIQLSKDSIEEYKNNGKNSKIPLKCLNFITKVEL